MPTHRLHGLLVTHLPNVRYLCGFTGSAGALVLTEEATVFFTDGRYTEQASREVERAQVVVQRLNPAEAACSWLADSLRTRKSFKLGLEPDHVTLSLRSRMEQLLPGNARVAECPPLVERLRLVKDQEEIALIRKAVKVGASLLPAALQAAAGGKKESEVAAEMEFAARIAGAEAMSFPTIVLAGKRSALPHGRATNQRISSGFVLCDFGVVLNGYCSDRTRTLVRGPASNLMRSAYQAVLEAQQAGIEAVKPGISAGEVDLKVRRVLEKHHLGDFFTHSTGHGVGLEIHEGPRIAAHQTQLLEPGMVITIEPGIYLSGKWGIRIEDMVLVTESGRQVLSPGDKQLITV